LAIGERVFERAEFGIGGRRDALALSLSARALGTDATLRVDGAWRDGRFAGSLADATFASDGDAPWRLEAPSAFTASAASAALDRVCWRQNGTDNTLCADLTWRADERLRARAELAGLPLQDLSRWLPTGFRYPGDVSGTAAIDWPARGAPVARGELVLGPGQWLQLVRGEPVALMQWQSARVDAALARGDVDGSAGFALVEGGRLEAAF